MPVGISEEEYINGSFTIARNRIITDIFLRLKLIEKLGTGIRRIKSIYAVYEENPKFEVMKNSIKITLPKIQSLTSEKGTNRDIQLLKVEEDKLFNYIKSCGKVSRTDVERYMGIKKTKATRLLNALLKYKLIKKKGAGRSVYYSIR